MNGLEFSEALENPLKEFDLNENIELDEPFESLAPHEVFSNVNLKITYHADYDANLILKGYLKVPCKFVCDRCATVFEKYLFIDIDEKIAPKYNSGDNEITYDMPRLDLNELAKSLIITSFPSKVLCREDCKGLCLQCGANLNDGDCGCLTEAKK